MFNWLSDFKWCILFVEMNYPALYLLIAWTNIKEERKERKQEGGKEGRKEGRICSNCRESKPNLLLIVWILMTRAAQNTHTYKLNLLAQAWKEVLAWWCRASRTLWWVWWDARSSPYYGWAASHDIRPKGSILGLSVVRSDYTKPVLSSVWAAACYRHH